jgi:cytoskeleton protein RodZ
MTQPKPFDERAAQEELEHVRQEIERYQTVRQDVIDEFDRFLKSFKRGEQPAAAAIPAPPAPVPLEPPRVIPPVAMPIAQPIVPPIQQPIAHPPPPTTAAASAPEEMLDVVDLPPESVPAAAIAAPPPPRQSHTTTWLVAGSVIAILSVGGYAWTTRGSRSETSNSPQPDTPTKAPVPAPQPSAPAAIAPAAPAPSPYDSVLVTTDPAWVRVVADGEKIVERELAANTRLPIRAEKTIQIRTGNAGAVKLIIGGVDRGPLGGEGEVITRTFTVSR